MRLLPALALLAVFSVERARGQGVFSTILGLNKNNNQMMQDNSHHNNYHNSNNNYNSNHNNNHNSNHNNNHNSNNNHHNNKNHNNNNHNHHDSDGDHDDSDVIYHTNTHNHRPYENEKCAKNELPPLAMVLGTSYSRVGYKDHDDFEIILNEEECCHSHSYVAVTGTKCTEIVMGPRAHLLAILDPTCAILDVKRLIGLSYEQIKEYIQKYNMPYDVVCHQDGRPQLLISTQGMTRSFYIEDVVAHIYAYMMRLAEISLCGRAKGVVITVPSTFTTAQRHTLKSACKAVGLHVLEVVCEISAAAMAAADRIHKRHTKDCLSVIIKVGEGFTDVAVFDLGKNGNVKVKAQEGATFGGNDIILRMFNYFVDVFKSAYSRDPTNDPLAVIRLKLAVEVAKKELENKLEASIAIEDFFDGITFDAKISRAKFEHLNEDIFEDITKLLQTAVNEAQVDKNRIEQVVLFGLSAKIARVHEIVQHFFKHPNQMWTYQHAAVEGAACIASSYHSHGDDFDRRMILAGPGSPHLMATFSDVTQQRFGVEVEGGEMNLMIEPNTPLPVNVTRSFTTTVDDQADALIQVFEGRSKNAADNDFLAELKLTNLQASPHGKAELLVTFEVTERNELRVMVCEKNTSNHVEKIITEPENLKLRSAEDAENDPGKMAIKTMY